MGTPSHSRPAFDPGLFAMRYHPQILASLMLTLTVGVPLAAEPMEPKVERHVLVFGAEGLFAGWPANHGIWMWGNEILVGFSQGTHRDLGQETHNIDREKPEYHVLARSLDGGETWSMEYPNERNMLVNAGGMRHGTTDPRHTEAAPRPISEPIDFTHPDLAMTLRFGGVDGGSSRLYFSYDRGHDWQGPFEVPSFGQPSVMARTDYLVNGPRDCQVFLTASKKNHQEGRVFCGRTTDGGVNWRFVSYVGPEPNGFSIMPSTVRLSREKLVMATRDREADDEPKHRRIETWKSENDGQSWQPLGTAVDDLGEGNPPAMIRLADGRLCLTYGVRKAPFEMQAKFSGDEGATWSEPFVLQTDGGGRDLGYPRTLQRPDGKVVTLYYFYPRASDFRRIMATIWDPGSA
jgi:BNR repeat-like domain